MALEEISGTVLILGAILGASTGLAYVIEGTRGTIRNYREQRESYNAQTSNGQLTLGQEFEPEKPSLLRAYINWNKVQEKNKKHSTP